jgi:sulfate/thiosulfate transport system ATP-binding protein
VGVKVTGVTKRFTAGGTPAVGDVTFTAPAGKITTLLGPSGSGKSTVLRIVAGLEPPDSGTVHFGGVDTTQIPVQKRGVGMVFQSYALFKHMTVAGNIAFGMKLRKLPEDDIARRVAELVGLVQLEGLEKRYPGQLSGGQKQRVAFARALAIQPNVLLLDEPFGALDAKVRHELRDWLRLFHERTPVTTLLVTHDQEEAMELSEHVVVMHEGKVEQAGAPHEIYDAPATPFVAAFVGGANVLRGRAQAGRADLSPGIAVDAPNAHDGANVQAFFRPHDVKLARAPTTGEIEVPISVARILRLQRVGGIVKLSLELPSGEPMAVEVAKAEFDALSVQEGDRVMVDLKEAKVFVEDYSI